MNLQLTILLVVGAVAALIYFMRKIRRSEINISDSIFWFLFVVVLMLLAIFPQIAYFFAHLFGFMSPSNFVFLCVVALLLIKMFLMSVELSKLRIKLTCVIQEQALREYNHEQGAPGDQELYER